MDRCIIHKNLGKLILVNQWIYIESEMENLTYHKNIGDFIEYLDKEKKFFNDVEEINKYNIGAIAELIQYYNVKEYNCPIYKKNDIKKEIKKYFGCTIWYIKCGVPDFEILFNYIK